MAWATMEKQSKALIESLERLSEMLVEYNNAACLLKGHPFESSVVAAATQPWDVDFGRVTIKG